MLDAAETETVREARARYFAANGLGDGGYRDRFVVLRIGGVPVAAFPNTEQRVRSVRLHDIHHVLTGYGTSWRGEAEIGAWELASGCRDHWAAWLLNGVAACIGLAIAPARVGRAFRRGRQCRNLYEGEWDERILERTVAEVRAGLGIVPRRPAPPAGDPGTGGAAGDPIARGTP